MMNYADNIQRFLDDVVAWKDKQGNATVLSTQNGIQYATNEFWTSGQRQGHSLHEISFRACYKPQLPRFFIGRLTAPSDRVYDPFSGRGTTMIQAGLMGREPVGNDVNPISAMLALPRLHTPTLHEVEQRLQQVPNGVPQDDQDDLLTFYHPQTLADLYTLRKWLQERAEGGLDHIDAWIRMVALNRLSGHSTGFFSVYTLPPNQAASITSQKRINAKRNQVPPERDIKALIMTKSKSLLKDGPLHVGSHEFSTGLAENTSSLATGSIDLVVTSPPFLDVVDYAADNWLRFWFAEIDPNTVAISLLRNPADWQAMVRRTLIELARVVRPGGIIAFEVGDVRSGNVILERLVLDAAVDLPLRSLDFVLVNTGPFTKTARIWKVDNNKKGTNSNRIVLFERS